jgi:preprotein translocase subunit SecD
MKSLKKLSHYILCTLITVLSVCSCQPQIVDMSTEGVVKIKVLVQEGNLPVIQQILESRINNAFNVQTQSLLLKDTRVIEFYAPKGTDVNRFKCLLSSSSELKMGIVAEELDVLEYLHKTRDYSSQINWMEGPTIKYMFTDTNGGFGIAKGLMDINAKNRELEIGIKWYKVKQGSNKQNINENNLLMVAPVIIGTTKKMGRLIEYARPDVHPQMGEYFINVGFTTEGADVVAKLTEQAINKQLAIIIDHEIYSMPMVMSKISGGRSVISGGVNTMEEVRDLAAVISAGQIPGKIEIISIE